MDKDKFRQLHAQGLITKDPPELWTPLHSRDKKWRNHYEGQNGIMMHLSGGWMVNTETFDLQIIDSDDIDYSSSNISSYLSTLGTGEETMNKELVKSVESVFQQLGYNYEVVDDEVLGHAIVVRHKFSVLGTKEPLTLKFGEYGFDPKKSMDGEFEDKLHSALPSRFAVNINHVPEFDDDGEELGTYGETGLEFTTEIDLQITADSFPSFVDARRK